MDYTQYSVEDLASDEGFIGWATASSRDAQLFWDDFIERHPEMKIKVLQARTLVLNLAKAEARRHPEEQIDRIWQGIDEGIEGLVPAPKPIRRKSYPLFYAMAACVCATVVALVLWDGLPVSTTDNQELLSAAGPASDFIEEVNTSGARLRVHLSDGSVVALENNSRLRYRKDYDGLPTRNVYLTGEAFFEVARDPLQPFLVHSGEVVTRVLGTSFWVKADGDEEVVVSVKTGKVSVYTIAEGQAEDESQKNAVILLPNQQVTYQRDLEMFGKALVSEPEIVLPYVGEKDFNFENKPAAEVFDVLEKAYGIEIIFDEEMMGNCFFTAPLGSEPLFEKLKIICRAIGARYEIIDARVVVTSTGC